MNDTDPSAPQAAQAHVPSAPQAHVPPAPQFTPAPPPYAPAPPTGAVAWGLGLLALIGIPFFSAFVAGIVMAITGQVVRRRGGLADVNGRNAANWGITYLVLTVVLCGAHVLLLWAFTRDEPVSGFFPLGIPITIWLVISVAHVVISIVGLVKALGRKTFWVPAIPFFGPSREQHVPAGNPHGVSGEHSSTSGGQGVRERHE